MGHLREMAPVEASAIIYLRLWFSGPSSQAEVWNDFARLLGAEHGRGALRSFESLCDMCVRHGRRPLMRHDRNCSCVGADESCFANFIACAAEGDREYAMLIATLLVRPDMAPCLLGLAEDVGLAFKQMELRASSVSFPKVPAQTVH